MQLSKSQRSVRVLGAAGALAIVTALSGCSGASTTPTDSTAGPVLGFSPMNQQAPALIGLGHGVTGYATGNGASDVIIVDPNNDAATQASQIKAWVENGQVQGFWSLAVSAPALKDVLILAQSKGIVAVVNGVPADYGFDGLQPGITFSVQGYADIGAEMGEAMGQCLAERGNGATEVIGIQLPAGQVGGPELEAGFAGALKKAAPNAQIVATVSGDGDVAKSQAAVASALQAHPNAIGVYGFNDEGATGSINAFKAAGADPLKTCVVTEGGSEQSAAAVADGSLYALTALQFEADLAQTVDKIFAMIKDPTALGDQLVTPIKTTITTVK